MLQHPTGRATLQGEHSATSVRLSLDTTTNTVTFVVADFDLWLWLRSVDRVTINDVEVWTEGNRWFAPTIVDLEILEMTGGNIVVGRHLDKATAQGGLAVSVRMAKNGSQDFVLDRPIPPSLEFSGGVDLPDTVQLSDDLTLRSRAGRIIVEGAGAAALDAANLRLALSMAFGHLCWMRYAAVGERLTIVFRQGVHSGAASDFVFQVGTDGYLDIEKAARGIVDVIQKVMVRLDDEARTAEPDIRRSIEWFLAARSVRGLLDFRVLSLFSLLEVLDKSDTLTGQSLSRLLNIPLDSAKALAQIRHDISHGRTSVHQAIRGRPQLDPTFFGGATLENFSTNPAATLMNYLVHSTNRLMLDLIGSCLKPATWVGR